MLCIQYWLFGVAIGSVALAGALSLFGGCSTRCFLKALEKTAVKLPPKKDDQSENSTSAISVVDLDLQLEHHQRGRCIAQSGLLLVAVIAIICATVLTGELATPANAHLETPSACEQVSAVSKPISLVDQTVTETTPEVRVTTNDSTVVTQ